MTDWRLCTKSGRRRLTVSLQHVIADTLRSAAVLIAAAIAFFVKSVTGAMADSVATIVVSVIILISLLPLLRGLFITSNKIIALKAPTPTIDV